MKNYNWKEAMPMNKTGKLIDSGMVHEAFGYASVCWDKDGVFESEKSIIAADNLISYIGMGFEEEIEALNKLKNIYKAFFVDAQNEIKSLELELKDYKRVHGDWLNKNNQTKGE